MDWPEVLEVVDKLLRETTIDNDEEGIALGKVVRHLLTGKHLDEALENLREQMGNPRLMVAAAGLSKGDNVRFPDRAGVMHEGIVAWAGEGKVRIKSDG
jgi:hypothetical protein